MRVIALDPSMADSDHAGDYKALVVLYLDRQARVYIDAFLVRLDATRLVEFVVGVWEAHQAGAFAVEVKVFQKLLLKDFARVGRERMLQLPLYGISNKKEEKKPRLRTLGPYLARKELRFKRARPEPGSWWSSSNSSRWDSSTTASTPYTWASR
jgi:hypothetical protein